MHVSTSFNTTTILCVDPSCSNCAACKVNIKEGHPQSTMSQPVRAHLSFAEKKYGGLNQGSIVASKLPVGRPSYQIWHLATPFLAHHLRSKRCTWRNTTTCKILGFLCKKTDVLIWLWNYETIKFLIAGFMPASLKVLPIWSLSLHLRAYQPLIMLRTWFSLFDHTCPPRTSKAFKSRMPQKRPETWS